MRIKRVVAAKHEAGKSPATGDFVQDTANASLVQLLRSLQLYQDRKWNEPRGDLYHWIPLLNTFDHILEDFNKRYSLSDGPQTQPFGTALLRDGLRTDDGNFIKGQPDQELRDGEDDEHLVCLVLDFTRFLLDNCANRSLYNSSEHLNFLLNSTSLLITVSTLHLGARLAATYYRSSHSRPAARNNLSTALLTSHYRIDPEKVQKLAEPFAANLQKHVDGAQGQAQTPGGSKGKEMATSSRKTAKQAPKIHPNDLAAFARDPQVSDGDFGEFAVVCFDTASDDGKVLEREVPQNGNALLSQLPGTPTPSRRISGPSRLSRSSAPDDLANAESSVDDRSTAQHKLVIQAQEVQAADIHSLLSVNLSKVSSELQYGFLVRLRTAKALCTSARDRRLALAVRILALANIAFLYPESLFQQKILQQDSIEPKQLQIVYQLADVAKPSKGSPSAALLDIVEDALEALEAIATRHKSKHSDIIAALGINVNHGILFQLLRSVVDDLHGDDELDTKTLEIHETIFGMLDNLLPKSDSRNSARTVDTLVSTGLFGVLVEILNIHSNRAQRTQHRVLLFVNEGMHVVRDGIRAFANAGGLDAVSELVAWEVNTCLQAVRAGQGLHPSLKSRIMDYEVPIWHQQTLRTILKVINHMLGHSTPNDDRLLRNLIDTPSLLKAMNDILRNGKAFGSNIYSQVLTMITNFLHNEPQSYNVIAEAGLSKSVLESVCAPGFSEAAPTNTRKVPLARVPGNHEVVCGKSPEMTTVSIDRAKETVLASNILCSSDVISNLPAAFGALCLNSTGMASFLNSRTIESYFEIFESPAHVKAFATEPTLAEIVGQGFDELVRHHPDLKTAVVYNVILTIARIDYRCRHLLSEGTEGKSGDNGSIQREQSDSAEDVVMSGSTEDLEQSSSATSSASDKDPGVLDYIGAICKFLMTFFGNHNNMTSMYVESGGLPFLMDLCSLPNMPHDCIKFHGYGSMHSFSKAVHMVVEAKPQIALPVILKYTSDALDQIRPLQEYSQDEPYFGKILDPDTKPVQEDSNVIQALVQVQVYSNLLQEIFSVPTPGTRDRNQSFFTMVNLTDMYVDVVRRMGLVSRFCLWELVSLLAELPENVRTKTAPRLDGYSDEALHVLGLETMFSARTAANTESLAQDSNASNSTPDKEAENSTTAGKAAEASESYSADRSKRVKTIRHLLTTLPDVIFCFFHNLGEKIVTRRRFDAYLRQNAFLVAETMADAVVAHLKYDRLKSSAPQVRKAAFLVVALEHLKSLLNCDAIVDSPGSHSCLTILLPALRNRGGVQAIVEMVKQSFEPAISHEFSETDNVINDTPRTLAALSAAIIQTSLTIFGCLTSTKYIADSHQSQILQTAGSETGNLAFNSAQVLVDLRYEIMPALEHLWNEKGGEKLKASSLNKIIRLVRIILEADHEHGASKKADGVPPRLRIPFTGFRVSIDKQRTLITMGYDESLVAEALYRCGNDREKATDYCELRKVMNLPRFPIPAYDKSSLSNNNPPASDNRTPSPVPALQRRDSQSTIPEQDSDVVESGAGDQCATTVPETAPVASQDVDVDDGRMAMSIDNLLNLSESEQAIQGQQQSMPNAREVAPNGTAVKPTSASLPIHYSSPSVKVGIEDLDKLRVPLRKNLINRVMDMLAVKDDKLSFELAELLSTAASKASSDQAMRDARSEFGETLIHSLVSFNTGDDFRGEQANISAIANLLAILLQEREFYEACIDNLQQFIDPLLAFVRVFPSNESQSDTYPWIGQILLIFERLLSEELQPAEIQWHAPREDGDLDTSDGQIANYREPILTDDQRESLFDAIIPVLPRVGKDRSLALSTVRVLAMLTRHRAITDKLALKNNLQKLFLMIKQLAGLTSVRLQSSFMLVLRHLSEDDETVRKTMRNGILSYFKNSRQGSSSDTTSFVRHHYAFVLRAPMIFLEVVNKMLKLKGFDPGQRPQMLVLKNDVEPELFSPWQPPNVVGAEKPEDGEKQTEDSATAIIPSMESASQQGSVDRNKAVIKAPVVESPGGLIHFLISQLLLYKDTDDQDTGSARTAKSSTADASSDVDMEVNDNTSDDESAAPHAHAPAPTLVSSKPEGQKKEAYKAEDHPIYQYRCFLLQCLTELLMSYNQAKIEFINYSRRADPKAMTPSKPKSGVLNYLLGTLIPIDHLERSTSIAALKKQGTSTWACSVVVALCMRTPETLGDVQFGHEREARDSDLLFVRKFVIEHAVKMYRDIQTSDVAAEVKYARLLSVSDLFNRVLLGRTQVVHSSVQRQPGENPKAAETEIARIMFEKNLISVLTTSLSEIDLAIPSAKRAVKYILRPLRTLTVTAVTYSQNADLSSSSGPTTEDDDISTATSVSDISDEREETPDLFRHSALGMLEPGHDEEESSSESEDDDEEMYDDDEEGYGDDVEFEDGIDQADDDEAVSDPDDEDMGSDGDMESRPGDMPLNVQVVIDRDDEMSPDEDDDDDDDLDDDDDDNQDDDMDEDEELEILEEIEDADGDSLRGDNEDEWEDDEDDEDDDPTGISHAGAPGVDGIADAEAMAEEFAEQLHRGGAFGDSHGALNVGGGFSALEDDVENGTYMSDLRLVRDEDEDEDDYPEDEDADDPDDEVDEGDFMYETYGDDEDEPFDMMDEAFGFLGGTRPHPAQFLPASFRRPDMIVTPDGGRGTHLFRGMRSHNRGPTDRHTGNDDGINPLLQRTNNESHIHRVPRPRPFEITGPGSVDFLRLMRGGEGGHSMIQDMFNAINPQGSPMSGPMWATVRNEELELILGRERSRPDWTNRGQQQRADDISNPPAFVPTSTNTRWQEEARLLFASSYVEKVNKIINSILKLLVPQAMKDERERKEKEEREAEESRKEEEKKRKEEQERLAREEEERLEKEREEQRQREEAEAARRAAEAEMTDETGEAMEGVETQADAGTGDAAGADEAGPGPSQELPRVMINMRGRQFDITDLGIDQEYLDALPEDLREEVIMQAVAERRTQQPPRPTAATTETPNIVDPAFLDALPEELRREIIQQEEEAARRRARQEERRRQQQAAGGPAAAEDMDTGSFLASLDPALRRQVLIEQALSSDILDGLPENLRQEAEELLQETEARQRDFGRRFGHAPDALGRGLPTYSHDDTHRRAQRKHIVQMLDKPGIATILRLLFIPQQGSLKESLNAILQNLAQNRQSRAELISLLLTILQDGSSDTHAVERSYATLTMRSKQTPGQQQTPRPLKRSLTGGLAAPLGAEMTPMVVIQQCLSALVSLVQNNGHAQTFFLNPHETPNTLKNKTKQKGKAKENLAQKYALNALLSLLDRKLIMENSACMEQLSTLLIQVTQPLNLLRRQERNSQQNAEAQAQETTEQAAETAAEPSGERTDQGSTETTTEPAAPDDAVDEPNKATDKSVDKKDNEAKKPKTPSPPVVPEHNLQLVINIITSKECGGKTFRDTLATINHLSAIPGAKDIFGRELTRQAQTLGGAIASDLQELLAQLSKETGSTVQSSALSRFSPNSSDQTKLLRVLMALDYLFAAKTGDRPQGAMASEAAGQTKNQLLSSLYESPTFSPAWQRLDDCLKAIQDKDNTMSIAAILLPLIEALMVVCKDTTSKEKNSILAKSQQFAISSPEPESSMDTLFFRFTEDHRKILNELVRNNPRLMSGTFSLLVKNPKVLEFDNKRNYFTRRMHTRDESIRRTHPALSFTVRRDNIFLDSYQKLFFKKPEEVKFGKLNIKFTGEEGVDAGGVTREWFQALTRQFFNPDYALFSSVAADRTTFHPNKISHVNPEHLHYFKFIGRIIGKALYENRPLDCHFSRAVYKRILGKQVSIKDMESLDPEHYKSLMWTLDNDITDVLTETFSVGEETFGEMETIDLIDNGSNITVTEENKHEWVQKLVEHKLTGSVKDQLQSFLQGFHEIVPPELISIFNEQELELLISGLPEIDIEDWKANTEYQNYQVNTPQIQWFWRAVRSFDKEERAKLLQFVTGTSKVPLNGFKELEGMNGFSKFNIHRDYGDKDRLPSSHTCFNQLDLPEYDDYETLRSRLYTALTAGGEYFGFA